jgi:adenylate cyclase
MGIEIERKFLVKSDSWKTQKHKSLNILQGYFPVNGFSLRVRVQDSTAFLTLKKKSSGISRFEFEYEIPVEDATQMIDLFCADSRVEKIRHLVKFKGFTWEVDEFLGDNAGLVVAEIELENENEQFEKPDWAGVEVTDDPKYLNASLARYPFSKW